MEKEEGGVLSNENAHNSYSNNNYNINISQVKRENPLSTVVRNYGIDLKTNGTSGYVGLCPFHEEKTPSFTVNDEKQQYHCFGCGVHGDVIEFVKQKENCGFEDALVKLGVDRNNFNKKASKQTTSVVRIVSKKEKIPEFRTIYDKTKPFQSLKQHKYAELKELNPKLHPDLRVGTYENQKFLLYPTRVFVEEEQGSNKYKIKYESGQMIYEDGFKRSFQNISGSFYVIPSSVEEKKKELYLCEGVATGEKIYTALSNAVSVLCYLSKNYLSKCLENVKAARPDYKIIIACDVDAVEDTKKIITENNYDNVYITQPSLTEQEEADFRKYEERENKQPDFWDLWKVGGVDRVKEELNKTYKPINYKCVDIEEFLNLKIPLKKCIVDPILREGSLAMIYAKRGVGKTFIALELGMTIASGTSMFDDRWQASEQRKVLFIDGEMPAGTMQKRLAEIIEQKKLRFPNHNFKLITPDLYKDIMPDLSTNKGQKEVELYVKDAEVIIIDNISTLCRTGKENESESWNGTQEWILSLRKRNKTVILIHHAGKNDKQRGTSKREDILDTVIHLKRPVDYVAEEGIRFIVDYEKARGFYGEDAKSFEVSKKDGDLQVKDIEKEEEAEILELEEQGYKHREIANMLNVTQYKTYNILKKHNKIKSKKKN